MIGIVRDELFDARSGLVAGVSTHEIIRASLITG
jgi:hypothetical protein